MVSSVGCYRLESVFNINDVAAEKIFVKMTDNSIYELDEWELLHTKDIQGKGIRKQPIYGQDYPLVTDFDGILSARDIIEICTEEFDTGGTVVAGIGSIVGLAIVGGIVYVITKFGRDVTSAGFAK